MGGGRLRQAPGGHDLQVGAGPWRAASRVVGAYWSLGAVGCRHTGASFFLVIIFGS